MVNFFIRFSLILLIYILKYVPALAAHISCEVLLRKQSEIINVDRFSTQIKLDGLGGAVKILRDGLIMALSPEHETEISSSLNVSDSVKSSYLFREYVPRKDTKMRYEDHSTYEENLLNSNIDYSKNPLLGASMMLYRGLFLNVDKAFSTASLNFIMKTQGLSGPLKTKVFFETTLTERLSEKYGRQVRFVADFYIPTGQDWVSIRFSDFKISGVTSRSSENLFTMGQEPTRIGFIFPKASKARVSVSSEIQFDHQLRDDEIYEVIDNLFIDHQTEFFHKKYQGLTNDRLKQILKNFFSSMQNPENQNWAVEVVRRGQTQIHLEFQKYQWTLNSGFSELVDMIEIMQKVHSENFFYEAGSFGKLHGKWAHAAQILSGLRGLSPEESTLVLFFISNYIANSQKDFIWPLWNLFFDSRGDGVTSNRFWRDLVDAE